MLARYLRSQDRPVRYALNTRDPALMEAIRNYLGINLRAEGLPATLRREPELRELHRQHPVLDQAFHSLMQYGHPADLMAYLDLFDQHGGPFNPGDQQDPFSRHLRNFATAIHSQDRQPDLLAQYNQQAVDNPALRAALRQHGTVRFPGHLWNAQRIFYDLPPEHPLHRQLEHVLTHLYHPEGPLVSALTRGHDIGHALTTRQLDLSGNTPGAGPLPGAAGVAGRRQQLRGFMSATLRDVVRPFLETGGA